MRFHAVLLFAVSLAPNSAAVAADNPDEAQAIREIERLGGIVERDDKLAGHPVTQVGFRFRSDFGDEHLRLLKPFTKLVILDLSRTKVRGTRIKGTDLRELNGL